MLYITYKAYLKPERFPEDSVLKSVSNTEPSIGLLETEVFQTIEKYKKANRHFYDTYWIMKTI